MILAPTAESAEALSQTLSSKLMAQQQPFQVRAAADSDSDADGLQLGATYIATPDRDSKEGTINGMEGGRAGGPRSELDWGSA